MENLKTKQFIKELKELLLKHNARISTGYADCSDTYTMYDEHIIVTVDKEKEERICDGWSMSTFDISIPDDVNHSYIN